MANLRRNKTTKHMRLVKLPFKKTLNKAYQKVKPTRPEIEAFKAKLIQLFQPHRPRRKRGERQKPPAGLPERYLLQRKAPLKHRGTDLVLHEDSKEDSTLKAQLQAFKQIRVRFYMSEFCMFAQFKIY